MVKKTVYTKILQGPVGDFGILRAEGGIFGIFGISILFWNCLEFLGFLFFRFFIEFLFFRKFLVVFECLEVLDCIRIFRAFNARVPTIIS